MEFKLLKCTVCATKSVIFGSTWSLSSWQNFYLPKISCPSLIRVPCAVYWANQKSTSDSLRSLKRLQEEPNLLVVRTVHFFSFVNKIGILIHRGFLYVLFYLWHLSWEQIVWIGHPVRHTGQELHQKRQAFHRQKIILLAIESNRKNSIWDHFFSLVELSYSPQIWSRFDYRLEVATNGFCAILFAKIQMHENRFWFVLDLEKKYEV